ncbi:MAG: acyl-CoA synthetase [Candidatus Cloacimonas sp. 4484_140]|nr:MAG: acyl-CoA synthetase [Candidatus Cloacimonas sp. 4484_140]
MSNVDKKTYNDICKTWKWKIPEYYNFAFDVVDKWAETDKTKLALVSILSDGESARFDTFYELMVQSNKMANLLLELGFKKGDKILFISDSVPEWYYCMLGMFKLGIVPMPGTALLTTKDIEYRLERSDAVGVITNSNHTASVEEALKKCTNIRHKILMDGSKSGWVDLVAKMKEMPISLDKDKVTNTKSSDPLMIYFTSGTTGHPKMVLHTHAYPLGHEVTARFCQNLKPTDLHWTVSDPGWAKCAWGKLFGQMIVGAAIIQWDNPGRFNADGLLGLMERYGVTTFCAPPTVYRMLIQTDLSKYKLKLRHCLAAGEPLNPEVIRVWKDNFNLDIYDFFGQTETVALLSNFTFIPLRFGSVGLPTPGHDVRVINENLEECPPNEEGQIALYLDKNKPKPPGLMKEYWKDPDIMAMAFQGDYYLTGDKAYRDEDGYFWFVGRDDDVIKSSGYRIGPFEVESVLIEHPAVAESAVVGVNDPDGIRGILVKAFIVLAKGYTPSEELTKEIQDFVKSKTAPYKYPRIIEYNDSLPKTVSGKLLRRELRKRG